jgi:putative ABC transport system substrate-binding protein
MRTIIFLVIFALSVVPLVLAAQSPGPVRRIGFLAAGSQAVITSSPRFAAFSQGLRDLGWMEGQNLVMETRYAEGTEARLPELAADLVNRQVEVLVVTGGASAIRAAQHATDTIPIVGVIMGDPVGDGLVASLARPGGNLTGISGTPWDMTGKRLELLKAAVPGVTRVTVLANPAHQPSSARQVHETQVAAHALGLQLHILELRSADAFEGAFAALTPAGVEALVVLTDPYLFERHVSVITTLARQHRLPTIYP